MDTAIASFQADKQAAITPKLGEVKPIDIIISLERRAIHEKTVTDLVEALARDGRFLQDIGVRDEGANGYRLIFGANRLEAWKRHFGEQTPIPADIFPSDTPDPRIKRFEIEENLSRNDLTAAERTAQEMRWVAAFKEELSGGNPVTPVTETGEAAESGNLIPSLAPARGGRGKKGTALQVAAKFGTGKRAVNTRRQSAAAVIGEKIDFDLDTPEELERKAAKLEKADKRQHVKPEVQPRKRIRLVIKRPTPPAEPHAGETGSKIEVARKAFNALASKEQFRFIHDICRSVGLEPLKMAPPAVFGLADEEPELAVDSPADVPPPTEAAAEVQPKQPDAAADLATEDLQVADDDGSDDAAAKVGETADQEEDPGAEDLEGAGDDGFEAADPEPADADLDAGLQDSGDHTHQAANQEPAGATKCGYCNIPFESGDQLEEFSGKLYHGFCVEDGKRCAKAKQAKQIAIAA